MEFTGKLVSIQKDWQSGKAQAVFSVNETSALNSLSELSDVEKLSIKAVKFRKKRSLDANAYFHFLVGKIADEMTISKAKAKNILLCKYGQVQELPDGSPMIYKTNAPVEYMEELESIHSIPVKFSVENGKEVVFYKIYRGSHTYNSKEMSVLIDGTVADAKELGIETMPPDEIERIKALWKDGKK